MVRRDVTGRGIASVVHHTAMSATAPATACAYSERPSEVPRSRQTTRATTDPRNRYPENALQKSSVSPVIP